MYETQEEAKQKLYNTVVLLDEAPVHITGAKGAGSKLVLNFMKLRNGSEGVEHIRYKGWEFRNLGPRLGYSNVKGDQYKEALYVMRSAVRKAQQTQGLSAMNVVVPPFKGSERLSLPRTSCSFAQIWNKSYFLDMLEQKYPSVEEVKGEFLRDRKLTSLAFSRQLAVNNSRIGPYYLEYKGKDIGYTEDFFRWKIDGSYNYLRESLEDINGLRVA